MVQTMIKVGDSLYAPLDEVLNSICDKAGLPRNLKYYYVTEEGNLAHIVSAYHNREEEEVVECDLRKVSLARALKAIEHYFNEE